MFIENWKFSPAVFHQYYANNFITNISRLIGLSKLLLKYTTGKNMEYFDNTMRTLLFDISIRWKWFKWRSLFITVNMTYVSVILFQHSNCYLATGRKFYEKPATNYRTRTKFTLIQNIKMNAMEVRGKFRWGIKNVYISVDSILCL